MVALIAGLMFLASAGGAIGSPAIEALFYARFGVQFLPYMYIAVGLVNIVTSILLAALFARTAPRLRYTILPLTLAVILTGERIVIAFDPDWFYPVLWLGMNVMWVVQGLMIWGLAGFVCDTRQAKRLFPLFSAGGILGVAIGGLMTKPLVHWLQTESLILVWAGALIIVSFLAKALMQRAKARSGTHLREPVRMVDQLRQGYRFVKRSPLMSWTSLAAVLFAILYFSLVFPFSKAAAAKFVEEDALAGFLGTLQGLSTGLAILLSLLFANRLYARFGFMVAILAYPVIYLVGFSMLTINAMFPALVFFRFIQTAWSEGVSEGAKQAIFNVVPPEQREQTRSFVRGIANQLGVSLAGVMLVYSERILQPQHVYVIGMVVAAITTYCIWRARRAYGAALVEALRSGQPNLFLPEEESFGGFQRDAAAVAAAVAGIRNNDAAVRRVSAEILGNVPVPEATDALVNAMDDDDPSVRVSLLRAIARSRAAPALLDIAEYIKDPEPEVRLEAVKTLGQLTRYPKGVAGHVQPLLNDPDPIVRCHAAAALLELGPHSQAEETLATIATTGNITARVEAFEALAQCRSHVACDFATAGLTDPHPAIRRAAAGILIRVDGQRCIPSLIGALADEDQDVREAVASAIGCFGDLALESVVAALNNPALECGALLALEHVPILDAAGTIQAYAHDRATRAIQYHDLWRQASGLEGDDERRRLLADALRHKSLGYGSNALRAIGLLGDRHGMALAIDNLQSPNPAQRANALETLEAVGESAVIRPLLTLWDRNETAAENPAGFPNGWLVRLLRDPDPWLRACAALAARDVNHPRITAELTQLTQSDSESFVRDSARSSMNGGSDMNTLPTLSLMERILFLRRVPLFGDLPPTDLKQIAAIAGEHFFVDGETIATQGEPGNEMFIIVSGEVLVSATTEDGTEMKIGRRKPGEYVGEMAIISHEVRVASLTASGDVRALCIGQSQFEEILRMRPETSLAIIRVLCERLKESISTQHEARLMDIKG
jgi:HEAT repeat protein